MSFIAQLTWGTTWRMILWGMALGAGLGTVYGFLVGWILGLALGLATGAIVGSCLGVVAGLAMSILTLITFRSPKDRQKYRVAMAFTATGIIMAAVVLYALQASMYDLQRLVSKEKQDLDILIIAPGVIAALASGCAAWHVAAWTWGQITQRIDSVEYQER